MPLLILIKVCICVTPHNQGVWKLGNFPRNQENNFSLNLESGQVSSFHLRLQERKFLLAEGFLCHMMYVHTGSLVQPQDRDQEEKVLENFHSSVSHICLFSRWFQQYCSFFFFDFLTAKLSVIQNRNRTFSSLNSIRKFRDCKRFKINK